MNEKEPSITPSIENKDKVETKEEVIKDTQKELAALKTQVEDIPVISTIVSSIVEKKDKLEPDQNGIKEIRELIKNKEIGKAFKKALDLISKLFSFKLQSGFDHLQTEEGMMKLDQLIKDNNAVEIEKYIKQYEKSLGTSISISDKSDVTYLMSKCKDALYDIAKKKEGKDNSKTTKYEYFTHALTNNGKDSPIGKVLLFNRGDFNYATEKKLFDKAVQSASGSGREHSAIITGYNQETGEITMTHSTTKGVHTGTLKEYLSFGSTKVDIVALNIANDKKQAVVDYVEEQKGKKYDIKGAASDVINGKSKSDDNSFYCSELIYKGLQRSGENIGDDMIYPGQMLNVLKPDYVTSIETSEVK